MSEQRAMQRLCGLMRKAVQDYEMLAPGDRVMVGVSGGKDSVALTVGLALLRQYIGFDYEVVAVTLDPQFDHQPMDYTALEALMWQATAGNLRIPGMGVVVAFPTALSYTGEGDGTVLRYTAEFTELIASTDREGTRYVD